jgi:hypothetical protein
MTFLNFSQLPESVFRPKIKGKYFSGNQIGKYFPLTGKCFPLINFPNVKQTHESLKSSFLKTTFRETNTPLISLFSYN